MSRLHAYAQILAGQPNCDNPKATPSVSSVAFAYATSSRMSWHVWAASCHTEFYCPLYRRAEHGNRQGCLQADEVSYKGVTEQVSYVQLKSLLVAKCSVAMPICPLSTQWPCTSAVRAAQVCQTACWWIAGILFSLPTPCLIVDALLKMASLPCRNRPRALPVWLRSRQFFASEQTLTM